MKNFSKGLIVGIVIMFVLNIGLINAGGLSTSINVLIGDVGLEVNGESVKTDTILFDGTTYVPLRAIAELLNLHVGWNGATRTASLKDEWVQYIDPDMVKGNWVSVAYVDSVAQFNPELVQEDLSIIDANFSSEKVYMNLTSGYTKSFSWVDDTINLYEFSSAEFMIKEIEEEVYMFMEHKSGDYLDGSVPGIYVFKKNLK